MLTTAGQQFVVNSDWAKLYLDDKLNNTRFDEMHIKVIDGDVGKQEQCWDNDIISYQIFFQAP